MTEQSGPPQHPIVYRLTDRLVVGVHPKGGVGNEHRVDVIVIEEYDKLLRTDPAWVTTDGKIQGTPP